MGNNDRLKRKAEYSMTNEALQSLKNIDRVEYLEMIATHGKLRKEIAVLTSLNAHLARRIKLVRKIHPSYGPPPSSDPELA